MTSSISNRMNLALPVLGYVDTSTTSAGQHHKASFAGTNKNLKDFFQKPNTCRCIGPVGWMELLAEKVHYNNFKKSKSKKL